MSRRRRVTEGFAPRVAADHTQAAVQSKKSHHQGPHDYHNILLADARDTLGEEHVSCAARVILVVCASKILVVRGIDLDFLAFIDKQRDVDHGARFECGGLSTALYSVSFHAGVSLCDGERHCFRHVNAENFTFVLKHVHFKPFHDVLARVLTDLRDRQRFFLKRLHVHKYVVLPVFVRMLHHHLIQYRLIHRLTRAERLFDRTAVRQVPQLGPHKRRALPGLHVQELHHTIHLTLDLDGHSRPQFIT
mmetsp:Transcript_59/g.95  ORF Transcript_59/g.95 Transcript_59/m.95 type:complete len:248 (-) Transcript_59:169-912(-)